MKTHLLLIGFLLFVLNVKAQIGIHSIYSPSIFVSKKNTSSIKKNYALSESRMDTVFNRGYPLFSEYIIKGRDNHRFIYADNSFRLIDHYGNKMNAEIDLERTRNRAKLLFFKMKMWRYFK